MSCRRLGLQANPTSTTSSNNTWSARGALHSAEHGCLRRAGVCPGHSACPPQVTATQEPRVPTRTPNPSTLSFVPPDCHTIVYGEQHESGPCAPTEMLCKGSPSSLFNSSSQVSSVPRTKGGSPMDLANYCRAEARDLVAFCFKGFRLDELRR